MVTTHGTSKRKATGGRLRAYRAKRLHEAGRLPAETKVSEKGKLKPVRTRGGNIKNRLQEAQHANVVDPKTKKSAKVKIKKVAENPANRHFVRRNILTKGAIIETEKGKARVTSRPGQDGAVNAVLVKD